MIDPQTARQLLSRIDMPLTDLPYTPEFEAAFAEFVTKKGNPLDRHGFWKLLLETASPIPNVPPALPASATSALPPVPSAAEPGLFSVPLDPPSVIPLTEKPTSGSSAADAQPSFEFSQPWEPKQKPKSTAEISEDNKVHRQRLLASIGRSEIATIEQKVAFLLSRYPETRDSDIALAIRYWSKFQADALEKWDHKSLDILFDLTPMVSITRERAFIQNNLGLFIGQEYFRKHRDLRQTLFHEYLAAHRTTEPEIRFYLDETGDNGMTHIGLAGICVMNWKQYEIHEAALSQWRKSKPWPETIHFCDTGNLLLQRPMDLLAELDKRKSGLLFVGYFFPSRAHLHQAIADLLIQVVMDSLRHMRDFNCLSEPRILTIVKAAEPGFDSQYLPETQQVLAEQVAKEFPDLVALKEIKALPKGREVFLECADIIAGGMQRRALYKGPNPKNVLAEAVFNVTGFEDPRDGGTVFKVHR